MYLEHGVPTAVPHASSDTVSRIDIWHGVLCGYFLESNDREYLKIRGPEED